MAVEGGMKCVKFLVFFFNFIFWLCGLALIVVGILVQVALHQTLQIQDATASGAPIVLIGIGVVIFFISFFGCCGAWKENYCMVTMFAILLSLIIVAEIAAAIAGYIFRNKITNVVQDSLTDMISNYNNSTADFRKSVDKLQEDGCHDAVEAILKKNILWVIVAALVIAFLQIMGIVFACLLMRGIRSGYEVM
ncbi:hypothetical protein INR49_000093 [Caranx melampygus]|nr:hypothetical protein INR49_000093 [Caranx melampygus]